MKQFESDMSDTYNIFNELETILYKVGDSPHKFTEDELMNMLIGVIELHKVRYEKMWASWNQLEVNRLKKTHKMLNPEPEHE